MVEDDIARTYILVRNDLPLAMQVVQVAHVCLQAGERFGQPHYSHLVLCSVTMDELFAASVVCRQAEVAFHVFYEPDLPGPASERYTALATQPVYGSARSLFKRYPLWKPPPIGD